MKRPWMPLYVADYLADTVHLTTAEHGAYLLLLMYYWTHGSLPADENTIRRITRMHAAQWTHSGKRVLDFFTPEGLNRRNKRADLELAKAFEISKVNSANAKRSHEVRKQSAPHTHTHKEESSLQSFSSLGESEQRADVRALGGARPSAAPLTVEKPKASKRPTEQARDGDPPPYPGLPTSEELRAKYATVEVNDGQRLGQDAEGNGGEKAQAIGLVRDGNGARPSDERVVRNQAEQQGMASLAGVLRSIGLAAGEPAAVNGERYDASPVAGMAEINGQPRLYKSNGRYYAPLNSPEQHAWEKHLDGSKRDAAGGWMYPSRWPPGHANAANP